MAGIDKTYTDSYNDYKEFKEWASDKVIKFPTGQKVNISDYIYDRDQEDFVEGDEISIMNTPTYVDIFLIQNCPIQFVQDRMKDVYSEESYNEFKNMVFPVAIPEEYKQNRKIKIVRTGKFPLYNNGINSERSWWLQTVDRDDENYWWYDSETKLWTNGCLHLPHNTNTSHHKTVKSLVRFLRKQYLPKGLEFTLTGRYVGEDFLIKIC
jgi:hypothetical protein